MPRLASLFFSEINTFFALQFRCSPPTPPPLRGQPADPEGLYLKPRTSFFRCFLFRFPCIFRNGSDCLAISNGNRKPGSFDAPFFDAAQRVRKSSYFIAFLACSKIGRSAVCTLRCIPPPAAGEYMRIWNTPIFVDPEMRRGLKAAENIVF